MEHDKQTNGYSSASAYAELRRLIVGPEREQIDTLQQRVEVPELRAEDVSQVLPAALRLRSERDKALPPAIYPVVEEAIRISIRKDPTILADAFFPIIGSAVRKSVASALEGMMQTLNQVMEQSLSIRSLQWRVEALRTGRSFAEIVLLRSMLYRVEQVFLIHKETGLVLQQRVAESVVVRDPSLVSGMLTAIQEFVHDSFGSAPNEELETFRVGSLDVWIQHGPHALLAVVIRGTPPKALQSFFASVLEEIARQKGFELEQFDGDPTPFTSCQEQLKACFVGQAPARQSWFSPAAALLMALALVGIFLIGLYFGLNSPDRWNSYMEKLRRQPGVVVTSVEKQGGRYIVNGLRDPLADDPGTLLAGSGIDPKKVEFRFEPYHSLQPAFEAERRITSETEAIESQTVHFTLENAKLPLEEAGTIERLAHHILALAETGRQTGQSVLVEVMGQADLTGTDAQNSKLSFDRAEEVRSALVSAGVPPGQVATRANTRTVVVTPNPNPANVAQQRMLSRSVSFRVRVAKK